MRRRRFVKTIPLLGAIRLSGCQEVKHGSRGPSKPTTGTPVEVLELPWERLTGPPGGPVTYISISKADPNWMYAATRTAGIFASGDGGRSWIQGFSGQHHRSRIWASSHDPRTAFTHREWTENGGRIWHHPEWSDRQRYAPVAAPATSLGGPTVARVYNLEWDPFDSRTIYAGTPEGLYLSFDSGRSWELRAFDGVGLPPDFRGWDFAVHPEKEGLIVAGVGNKVAKSTNRGETWSVIDLGVEDHRTRNRFIRGVEFVDARSDDTYLAIERVGVFKSVDESLTELTPNLPALVFPKHDLPLTLSADRSKLYFIAGQSREMYPVQRWWEDRRLYTYDAESAEVALVESPVKPNAIAAHPDVNTTLFVGGNSWIHETRDSGRTWKPLSEGFVDHYLSTVAVNPTRPDTVLPGSICSTGLSVSYDRGDTFEWKRSGLGPWHEGDFNEHYIMHVSARGERVYATTAAGLLISEDNGESWRTLENQFSGRGEWEEPDTHLHGLAVHPEDSETVYVGTGRGGVGGKDDDAFAGAKIWKSTDGGETWMQKTMGFPTEADTTVQDIVIDPHAPDVVYAATNAVDYLGSGKEGGEGMGIYKTIDGGRNWERLATPFDNVHAVSVDAADADTIYASTPTPEEPEGDGGAYRSEDGGRSWNRILPYETHALMAHPTEAGVLFAGSRKYTDYWEVIVSEDSGKSWSEGNLRIRAYDDPPRSELEFNAAELHSDYWGDSSGQIMWFALDGANSLLYTATNGAGLWRVDTSILEA